MANPEPPKIKPPNSGEIKQIENKSFARRNIWLIVIIAAFAIIGVGSWIVYKRVKKVLKRYESIEERETIKTRAMKKSDSAFVVPYNNGIKSSVLNIEGSSIFFRLEDTTNCLFIANTKTQNNECQFDGHNEKSVYVMNFSLLRSKKKARFVSVYDTARIKLNVYPEWEIDINASSSDLDFDLSKFKIKTIKLNGGAGTFAIKLGQPLITSDINIATGAASVKFVIPQNAACRITTSSTFSSNDFEGFIKRENRVYETPGFNAAKNKFNIQFGGAMSEFEVKRY